MYKTILAAAIFCASALAIPSALDPRSQATSILHKVRLGHAAAMDAHALARHHARYIQNADYGSNSTETAAPASAPSESASPSSTDAASARSLGMRGDRGRDRDRDGDSEGAGEGDGDGPPPRAPGGRPESASWRPSVAPKRRYAGGAGIGDAVLADASTSASSAAPSPTGHAFRPMHAHHPRSGHAHAAHRVHPVEEDDDDDEWCEEPREHRRGPLRYTAPYFPGAQESSEGPDESREGSWRDGDEVRD